MKLIESDPSSEPDISKLKKSRIVCIQSGVKISSGLGGGGGGGDLPPPLLLATELNIKITTR